MIESLLLVGKKFAFGFLNLALVVALLSWLMTKIKVSPRLRLLIWSAALVRFLVDILWRHESALAPKDLAGEGFLSLGLSAPDLSTLRLMLSISDEHLSFGDVLQVSLGDSVLTGLGGACVFFAFTFVLHTLNSYRKLLKSTIGYPIIGTYRGVPIRLGNTTVSPYVIGVNQPSIVMPGQLLSRCSQSELAAILAHEHAHIQRRDHLTVPLLALLRAVFVLATPLRRVVEELRQAMELDCDQRSAKVAGSGAILSAMKKSLDCLDMPQAAVPGFGIRGMRERIDALTNPAPRTTLRPGLLLAIAGLLILGIRIL